MFCFQVLYHFQLSKIIVFEIKDTNVENHRFKDMLQFKFVFGLELIVPENLFSSSNFTDMRLIRL